MASSPDSRVPALRDYQATLRDTILSALESAPETPILLYLPTGGGKTRIAVAVCETVLRRDARALFVVNRSKLVPQVAATCDAFGLAGRYAFIKAGLPADPTAPMQIASIQTLYARRESPVSALDELPAASIVFVDEAHGAVATSYAWLLRHYKKTKTLIVGLSATPMRLRADEPLSRVFPRLLQGPSVPELMRRGVLVPTRTYFAKKDVESTTTGTGTTGRAAGRARSASLPDAAARGHSEEADASASIAEVVQLWRRTCSSEAASPKHRPTLVFATDVAHAIQFVRAFEAAGLTAACLSGDTPTVERETLCESLATGRLAVLCSVNVLSEGFDVPAVSAVILARPTRSAGLYVQQVRHTPRRGNAESLPPSLPPHVSGWPGSEAV